MLSTLSCCTKHILVNAPAITVILAAGIGQLIQGMQVYGSPGHRTKSGKNLTVPWEWIQAGSRKPSRNIEGALLRFPDFALPARFPGLAVLLTLCPSVVLKWITGILSCLTLSPTGRPPRYTTAPFFLRADVCP